MELHLFCYVIVFEVLQKLYLLLKGKLDLRWILPLTWLLVPPGPVRILP